MITKICVSKKTTVVEFVVGVTLGVVLRSVWYEVARLLKRSA